MRIHNTKRILTDLKRVRLADAEHAHLRDVLHHAIAARPVTEDAVLRRMLQGGHGIETPVRPMRPMPRFAPSLAPALAMLLLFSAMGVSYAAEGTVPGQLLYSVKVRVNEPARGAFALTPEAKVVWETEQLKRRIEEAQILTVRGELTDARSAMLAERVTRQGEALTRRVEETGTKRNVYALTGASIDATAIITAQGEILITLAGSSETTSGGSTTSPEVLRITQAIDGTTAALGHLRDTVEGQAGLLPTSATETTSGETPKEIIDFANQRQMRAERAIADTRTVLREKREQIPELIALQARAMVQRAEEYLHQGEAAAADMHYALAADWFAKAQTMASRAKALIEANLILEVEVTLPEDPEVPNQDEGQTTEEGSGEAGGATEEETNSTENETGGAAEEDPVQPM